LKTSFSLKPMRGQALVEVDNPERTVSGLLCPLGHRAVNNIARVISLGPGAGQDIQPGDLVLLDKYDLPLPSGKSRVFVPVSCIGAKIL